MEKSNTIYLKGLNGIRAIAALGVLLSHTNLALKHFNVTNYSLFGFGSKGQQLFYILGRHGVTMFFVLSGFLITFLLLKEIDKAKKIDIKSFYIRRILRIWPLYFLYFGLCLLFLYIFKDEIPPGTTLLYYIFFLANIPFVGGFANSLFAHLWSIAVEEQFYLFWPHLFRYKEKLIKIVIGLIIFQGVIRVVLWGLFPHSFIATLSSVNRFDCMMIGGLGAILLYQNKKINFINNKFVQIVSWVIVLSMILNFFKVYASVVEFWIVSLATVAIIIGQIKDKNKIINLENKFFNFFGILSFGIYVYHPLVIYLLRKSELLLIIDDEFTRAVSLFILIITLTTFIAWLSYTYIESQFLKLKYKFQIIKSTNKDIK
ncbi:hypothetical protein AS589_02490 [Empedobacter brevis]|uniref:acyltransferase family protein n=1 Tax=Empedobacter brevis TaxID=247 RepID=UPI0013202D01|nr:acyltransferase [Empedobacter brevis]QHC83733.1 hypothetical protein AS589_02490 [Empedobacter brevis]